MRREEVKRANGGDWIVAAKCKALYKYPIPAKGFADPLSSFCNRYA